MSRDVKLLHPKLQQIIPIFLNSCNKDVKLKNARITVKTLDTLRNKVEQDSIPSANTKAKYPNSMHNWGVAFDIGLFDSNGNYISSSPLYEYIGRIGKSVGLRWGGEFRSIHDTPHYQLLAWGDMPSEVLIPKYKIPDNFIKTWGDEVQTQMTKIIIDGKEYKNEQLPLINSHLYMPLREIAEATGYNVSYLNGVVTLTKK